MSSPDQAPTQDAADQLRSAGYPSLAAFLENNDPEKNPDIWQPDFSDEAIVNSMVSGYMEQYRSTIEETVSGYVEQIKNALSS